MLPQPPQIARARRTGALPRGTRTRRTHPGKGRGPSRPARRYNCREERGHAPARTTYVREVTWATRPTPAPSQSRAAAASGLPFRTPSSSGASRSWWRVCWAAWRGRTGAPWGQSAGWTSPLRTATRPRRRLRPARAGACAPASIARARTASWRAAAAWLRTRGRAASWRTLRTWHRSWAYARTRRTAGAARCATPSCAAGTPRTTCC